MGAEFELWARAWGLSKAVRRTDDPLEGALKEAPEPRCAERTATRGPAHGSSSASSASSVGTSSGSARVTSEAAPHCSFAKEKRC